MRVEVTGTPGTGKTAVCKVLRQKFGYKIIDLNELILKKKIYSKRDKKRETLVADIEKLRKYFAGIKGDYIAEGHLAHHMDLDLVIVLRTKPETLKKRLQTKKWSEAKIRENVEAEALDVILIEALQRHEKKKVHEVDTTKKTSEEVAQLIDEIIKGKRACPLGRIDWSAEVFG